MCVQMCCDSLKEGWLCHSQFNDGYFYNEAGSKPLLELWAIQGKKYVNMSISKIWAMIKLARPSLPVFQV